MQPFPSGRGSGGGHAYQSLGEEGGGAPDLKDGGAPGLKEGRREGEGEREGGREGGSV